MTNFSRAPKVLKGALVAFDLPNPTPNVIVFQYNPSTLTRTLKAQTMGGGEGSGSLRLTGAPVETISLDVEIDATDQLEKAQESAVRLGIHPQLAALEVLLYPKSVDVMANLVQMNMGIIEVVPPAALFTLLIYGSKRILPVKLTDYNVTEEAHDTHLNPTRAKVSLSMRALSYNDIMPEHPGHAIYMAYQVAKETMARVGISRGIDAIGGGNIKLL